MRRFNNDILIASFVACCYYSCQTCLSFTPTVKYIVTTQSKKQENLHYKNYFASKRKSCLAAESAQQEWKEKIQLLCKERNFPFERVKNARDLASVRNSPIQKGRVLRMGKVTDATLMDMDLLFNDLGVRTLIDLRSPTELKDEVNGVHDDGHGEEKDYNVYEGFTNLVWRDTGKVSEVSDMSSSKQKIYNGNLIDDEHDEGFVVGANGASTGKERHFVSLMNEFKYVRGTMKKLKKRDIAKAVLKSPGAIVSRRVRTNIKSVFLKEINQGGLPMLNELMLRMAGPGIKYVLDLCSCKERHPVAFYCTAGKDRTGILASIILATVGVADEDVVEDYSLSANVYAEMDDHKAMVGALSQRNLDAKTFLGAPPEVMQETLDTIRRNFGSIEGYMDSIGFDSNDRERLKKALILP